MTEKAGKKKSPWKNIPLDQHPSQPAATGRGERGNFPRTSFGISGLSDISKRIHKMLQCKIPGRFSQSWAGEWKQNHPGGSLKSESNGIGVPTDSQLEYLCSYGMFFLLFFFYNLISDGITNPSLGVKFMERRMNNAGVSWF